MKIITKNITKAVLRMITETIRKFILAADLYLHYSNHIILEVSNVKPVINRIFLRISNLKSSIAEYITRIFVKIRSSITSYISAGVNVNSFEGVIERYCGVPP